MVPQPQALEPTLGLDLGGLSAEGLADYAFGGLENHLVGVPAGLFVPLVLALSVDIGAQEGVT